MISALKFGKQLVFFSLLLLPTLTFGQDEWTAEKLFDAARQGDLEYVKKAIENKVDVNSKSQYGATALSFACDRGHTAIAEFLLTKGADPNVKDRFYNFTPLTWAQFNGHFEIAGLLFKYGADGADQMLMTAVSGSDAKLAKIVLDSGKVTPTTLKAAAKVAATRNNEELSALFADLEIPEEPPFKLDVSTIEKYVGKYRDPRMSVKVSTKDEKVMLAFGETDPIEMEPVAKDEFMLNGGNIKFEFDNEKVSAVVMKFGPNEMRLTPESAQPESTTETEPEEDEPEETEDWDDSSKESKAADLAVSSKNWPSFRGNGARGVADGQNPPVEWDVEADENVLWKTPVPGLGLSCPVIWDDKLFITSAVSEKADGSLKIGNYGDVGSVEEDFEFEFQVICLNKKSGEILWKKTANKAKPAVKRHTKSSHANPTVATDGKHVIAFFSSEGLYCYDMDGNLKWKKDLGFLDSGWFYDPGYQWGFGASPIIYGDHVIVQCDIQKDSFIAAFNLSDGAEAWRTARDEIPSWSTPTVHEFGDLPMLITGGTKAARGYDARDGKLIWSLKDHSEIVVPTPFVAHDLIYLASGYSPIQPIYAVKPDARGDISLDKTSTSNAYISWSRKKGGPYMPSPIVYGDYLYTCANRGILACYEATTGDLVYKKRLPGGGVSFTASPLAADGHLYFTAENGRVIVVEAGPEFEHVATNKAGESILATPAISEGALFLRTQESVIAVGTANE